METKRIKLAAAAIAMLFLCGMAKSTFAQNVDVRISTREAYVGMPIVLQIAINNASDYKEPILPVIDGCDVRAAGTPSQSSQITIINGRRSESRSVTMQYLITPRRAGAFEIPALTINVGGRDQVTAPLRFVATKSETGDLLFVEIEGDREKVFVGQPLEMTLKIWIKPFVDRERNIKLSEANMWQTISQQTSWGSFGERLKEMAANNQRPGGREVLRDDGNGTQREYYLYEIEGTVYPKRPGRIDADDVQIVVNYPTALGKSRDPFDSFFKDSPFGGSPFGGGSRLSQLMDDDFFSSSPFGNRLAISATRPLVGEAAVGSTEVVPVPTEGRPADYRGAVGRYRIVTQATPTAVSAGDPITLNIGVLGTGPMELVQAPPLSELPSLTDDFKVADQSLAGFVKDETKVFPTTIRPRREGITQIPAIPFSFFDPDTESFETVMSEPIAITVEKSESLALDAIVGKSRRRENDNNDDASVSSALDPDFTNQHSADVLVSQAGATTGGWWWAFVVLPPFMWLATLLFRNYNTMCGMLPNFKSVRSQCLSAIERATHRAQIEDALIRYIGRRTGQTGLNASSSVGALRTAGLYPLANEVESFFQSCEHSAFNGAIKQSNADLKREAQMLVEEIETTLKSGKKAQVQRSSRRRVEMKSSPAMNGSDIRRSTRKASLLLMFALFAFSSNSGMSSEEPGGSSTPVNAAKPSAVLVELSAAQQQQILQEAGEIYSQATAMAKTDMVEASDLFAAAATKYQLLVDSGIENSGLYINLGNACLQSNQLGRAIANYERAKQFDPANRQLAVNLELANSLVVHGAPDADTAASATTMQSLIEGVRSVNDRVIGFVGRRSAIWLLATASFLFWGILIARAAGFRLIPKRWAIVPLFLLVIPLSSVTLADASTGDFASAIIATNNVTLRSGDGESFEAVHSIEAAQGHRVQVLAHRSDWTRVRDGQGHVGWIENGNLEFLN